MQKNKNFLEEFPTSVEIRTKTTRHLKSGPCLNCFVAQFSIEKHDYMKNSLNVIVKGRASYSLRECYVY
jgi:hypothetical protein